MPEDLWSAVFSKLDTDGDGMVQIGEFMKQMKNAVADDGTIVPSLPSLLVLHAMASVNSSIDFGN